MAGGVSRERVIRAACRAARAHRTPFYLFDRAAAAARLRQWRRAAGHSADLFYPWKCNRHPALLALAEAEGFGAEVTNPEDVTRALRRLRAGRRILFQGPAKDEGSIGRVLRAGAWLAADSEEDALAILRRAIALRISPRYVLRFRPAAVTPMQECFGLSPAAVLRLCARIVREGLPRPAGLAFHLGTGLPGPAPYLSAIREAGRLARRLAGMGIRASVLDIGGGFAARGESRGDGRRRTRAAPPGAFLDAVAAEVRRRVPGARLFLEPGRAIASDAFHLVTRVVRVSGHRIYVDASRMSHAFFVPLGRHPFWLVPPRPERGHFEIAGPLPVALDRLTPRRALGRPREGDLLVVGSVGAYNPVAASAWAGRMPRVVEIGNGS
jgi:diaminopimelate decarboxylase